MAIAGAVAAWEVADYRRVAREVGRLRRDAREELRSAVVALKGSSRGWRSSGLRRMAAGCCWRDIIAWRGPQDGGAVGEGSAAAAEIFTRRDQERD